MQRVNTIDIFFFYRSNTYFDRKDKFTKEMFDNILKRIIGLIVRMIAVGIHIGERFISFNILVTRFSVYESQFWNRIDEMNVCVGNFRMFFGRHL